MGWFNVEEIKPPSKEPPPSSRRVVSLNDRVLRKGDTFYYKFFGLKSRIDIYDMHPNYFFFLARQYVYNEDANIFDLYSEYRLTLTEDARKIVNELLSKPFKCYVNRFGAIKDYLYYECITYHPVSIPHDFFSNWRGAIWNIGVFIEKGVIEIEHPTSIPFNCGPLYPLWERAVECWIDKIAADIGPKHAVGLLNNIRHELLERKYIYTHIIPVYYI